MSIHCQYTNCNDGEPHLAEHGPLCHYHYAQLGRNLSDTPELIETALHHRNQPTRPTGGDKVSGSKNTHNAPANLTAIGEADELHTLIAITAEAIAAQIRQPPPRIISTRGISTHTTPAQAQNHARDITSWLLRHLREATITDDILDLAEDLETTTRRMRYLWPIAEKDRHLPGARCRTCHHQTLYWTPPPEPHWPITVQCDNCGYVAPEHDLTRLTRLVEYTKQEGA